MLYFDLNVKNKLTWNHDEINKNHSTGSNYYMNFNLKGRESVLFDLQAVAVKRGIARWEAVEIVITDPFGFMTNHITYKRVENADLFSFTSCSENASS